MFVSYARTIKNTPRELDFGYTAWMMLEASSDTTGGMTSSVDDIRVRTGALWECDCSKGGEKDFVNLEQITKRRVPRAA